MSYVAKKIMQQLWGIQTVDKSAVKVMAPQEAITFSQARLGGVLQK